MNSARADARALIALTSVSELNAMLHAARVCEESCICDGRCSDGSRAMGPRHRVSKRGEVNPTQVRSVEGVPPRPASLSLSNGYAGDEPRRRRAQTANCDFVDGPPLERGLSASDCADDIRGTAGQRDREMIETHHGGRRCAPRARARTRWGRSDRRATGSAAPTAAATWRATAHGWCLCCRRACACWTWRARRCGRWGARWGATRSATSRRLVARWPSPHGTAHAQCASILGPSHCTSSFQPPSSRQKLVAEFTLARENAHDETTNARRPTR